MTDRSVVRRIAFVSLLWTVVLAGAKLAVAVRIGSVALLADGVHSAIDLVAGIITLVAVRWASLPPDREHPYGHGRAENLAALGQAVLIAVVAFLVTLEAAGRLRSGAVVGSDPLGVVVVAGAIVVDLTRARVLRRAAKRYGSPALEADALNFTGDIAESLAVLAGLVSVRLGFRGGDPVAAIVVAAVMAIMAARVGRASVQVLMDRHPETLADRVAAAAGSVAGVMDVGGLRVRRSGPDVHAEVTVTVGRTSTVEQSHGITEAVEDAVARAVPGATATVHVEPSREGEDLLVRTFAAANRIGLADQVHNVLVIRHPEGMWLLLHAKVAPEMPLAAAHEVADQLERELRSEIDGLSRVEIHLEPREPVALYGAVVSAQRDRLAADVRRIAEGHPPITRVHEVAISETPDGLHVVLHCEAPAATTIADIHEASLRVEGEIHRRYAEVRTITAHFEPARPHL